ncbi:cytochrome P450 86B1-like protein [Tanacetum coccineum]
MHRAFWNVFLWPEPSGWIRPDIYANIYYWLCLDYDIVKSAANGNGKVVDKRGAVSVCDMAEISDLITAKRIRVNGIPAIEEVYIFKDETVIHFLNSKGTYLNVKSHLNELEQQKASMRGKSGIPNKQTRSSTVDHKIDARPNTPAKSPGSIERDREVVRLPTVMLFRSTILRFVSPNMAWKIMRQLNIRSKKKLKHLIKGVDSFVDEVIRATKKKISFQSDDKK